jgi:hypothetical protein
MTARRRSGVTGAPAVVAGFALAVVMLSAGAFSSCSARGAATSVAATQVVLITPPESSAPLQYRGAEAFVRDHAASKGLTAVHVSFPDAKKVENERSVAAFIEERARDERVAAIVVAPAPQGTAEGFRRAKEKRPGILCVCSGSSDEPLAIESAADLVVDLDRVGRAYLSAWEAKKMGASALVAAYTRDEDSDPVALRERAIMRAASVKLGLKYAAMVAPKGVGAEEFARAGTGAWLRDYGPKASLYCSDPSLAGPVLSGAVAGGGIVAEAAGEATRAAYAAALGVDLSEAKGDRAKERRLLEKAASAMGLKGRLGLWDSGYGEASARGLGEFAMRVGSGSARKDDLKGLTAAFDARSEGAAWLADYDVDPDTGVKSANHVLLRQDVYVLGSGYLQSALRTIPPEYLTLGSSGDK